MTEYRYEIKFHIFDVLEIVCIVRYVVKCAFNLWKNAVFLSKYIENNVMVLLVYVIGYKCNKKSFATL